MKRFISILFFTLICTIQMVAEPGNNLNKTLSQIQREFPDCIFWCESARGKYYKSDGDGLPIMFEIKNGKVISEFILVNGEGSFPKDWFIETVNAFSNSDYKHVLPSDGNAYSFIYSYFSVYISYNEYQNNSSITYELLPRYIP